MYLQQLIGLSSTISIGQIARCSSRPTGWRDLETIRNLAHPEGAAGCSTRSRWAATQRFESAAKATVTAPTVKSELPVVMSEVSNLAGMRCGGRAKAASGCQRPVRFPVAFVRHGRLRL